MYKEMSVYAGWHKPIALQKPSFTVGVWHGVLFYGNEFLSTKSQEFLADLATFCYNLMIFVIIEQPLGSMFFQYSPVLVT